MKVRSLREEVLEANLELWRRGLVLYTFGNASGIAREEGLVVIKPSGVPYETMKAEDLVVVDLDGRIAEGSLRPSSDLPTHLVLYQAFAGIGAVAHTHSRVATSWAQAQREIPCLEPLMPIISRARARYQTADAFANPLRLRNQHGPCDRAALCQS